MNRWPILSSVNFVADDPGAISQLRKLVVLLAISGRLPLPSGASTDASAIATRIDQAKQALVRTGVLKKHEPMTFISADDLPDALPASVNFVRLGSVASVEKGLTGIKHAAPGPFPLVVTAEGRSTCDHFDFDGAAAIVPLVSSAGHGKASLQRLHYQEGKFALGSILAAVFPYLPELVSARFLFEYLTAFKDELLVSQMIGTANVSLSIGKVSDVPVPLLAPAVQQRVDELMALCDQLEAARAEREAARDRLVAASLARLNAPDPETFDEDARFALDALPALTARPDQIKQLRQTIRNLAVRGRLVPQDAEEGTGGELFAALKKARSVWESAGRIRREKGVSTAIPNDEKYHTLPESWAWARLVEIGQTQTGTSPSSGNADLFGDFMPFVKPADLDGKEVNCDGPGLSELGVSHSRLVSPRSVLVVCIGATLGKVNKTTRPVCFNQQINSLTPFLEGLSDYLALAMKASAFQALAWSRAGTGTLPIISKGKWEVLPVPLPPLPEQHRIVTKVAELMALCDRLEASLASAVDHRSRLHAVLLREALHPAAVAEDAAWRGCMRTPVLVTT